MLTPSFVVRKCQRPMEKYGYMGLLAVQIDRCDDCSVVWLDANQLQNMILTLAKTNYRGNNRRREAKKEELDLMGGVFHGAPVSFTWLYGERFKDKRDIRNWEIGEMLLYLLLD